jgi:hypothetical protein
VPDLHIDPLHACPARLARLQFKEAFALFDKDGDGAWAREMGRKEGCDLEAHSRVF